MISQLRDVWFRLIGSRPKTHNVSRRIQLATFHHTSIWELEEQILLKRILSYPRQTLQMFDNNHFVPMDRAHIPELMWSIARNSSGNEKIGFDQATELCARIGVYFVDRHDPHMCKELDKRKPNLSVLRAGSKRALQNYFNEHTENT